MTAPPELVCRDCGKRYPRAFPECPKCYLLKDRRGPDDRFLEDFKKQCRAVLADATSPSKRRKIDDAVYQKEVEACRAGIACDLLGMFEFCKVYRVSLGARRAYYTNHSDAWYAFCYLKNKFKGRTDIFHTILTGLPCGIVPDFEIIHTKFSAAHFSDE